MTDNTNTNQLHGQLEGLGRLIERLAGRPLTSSEQEEISTHIVAAVFGLKTEVDNPKGLPELADAIRDEAARRVGLPQFDADSVTHSTRRLSIVARPGHEVNFGDDYEVASDVVGLIYDGAVLVGWGDDYGTVRHPDRELPTELTEAAERFIEAASDLWTALPD